MRDNGHSFEEIKRYTIGQMLLFYNTALKARMDYIYDVRMAVWSDQKDLEKYMKDICKY